MDGVDNNKNRDFDNLFFKVWRNKYLKNIIIEFIKLLKNQRIVFKSRESLLGYKDREYIQSLIYCGRKKLEIGDLPSNGLLKTFEFTQPFLIVEGTEIPNGVESVIFSDYDESDTDSDYASDEEVDKNSKDKNRIISLNNLPSSVTNVENVILPRSPKDDNGKDIIPKNIKSIKIKKCPLLSNDFKIPNSVTSLSFGRNCYWNFYKSFELKEFDLPSSITKLKFSNKSNKIKKNILPNSIINLQLIVDSFRVVKSLNNDSSSSFGGGNYQCEEINFNFESNDNFSFLRIGIVPNSVKSLTLICGLRKLMIEGGALPTSLDNLTIDIIQPKSIDFGGNKLNLSTLYLKGYEIDLNNKFIPLDSNIKSFKYYCKSYTFLEKDYILNSNILPDSITDLTIMTKNVHLTFQFGSFPKNLKKLSIIDRYVSNSNLKIDYFPSSLTELNLCLYNNKINFQEIISILPESLHTINLNESIKDKNLIFKSHIKNIFFK
ncbi:hypothetical protein ACTA71_009090 [Dictyostelium dimigraforme]